MGAQENIDIDFLVNDAVDRFLSFKKYKIRLNRLGFSDDEVVKKWIDGVTLEQVVKGEMLPEKQKEALKDNVQDYISRSDISELLIIMNDTYIKKNHDYGNSFGESLDEDGLIASKVRIGDKFKRFGNLIRSESKVKDESIEDTLLDMAIYAVMTVDWMRKVNYEQSE